MIITVSAINKMESTPSHVAGVTYPVDHPGEDFDYVSFEADKKKYFDSDIRNTFTLPHGLKVDICHDNIARISLFSCDLDHSVFVLHLPGDENHVVAVYLHKEWWSVQDIMKTSCTSRCGLIMIIFGILERTLDEEIHFSPHGLEEFGKIFWKDGEAVGFYTIKKKGTLCNSYSGQSYLLPVLDTLYVRTAWRRKGLALQMLEDFCSSFTGEEALGVSYPISTRMYEVCRKFLEIHQEERDRLYEVKSPGDWGQRRNVWLGLQLRRLPKQSEGCLLTFSGQSPQTISTEKTHGCRQEEGKVDILSVSADGLVPPLHVQNGESSKNHFEIGGLPTNTVAAPEKNLRNSGRKRATDHANKCENTKQRRPL